MPSCETCWRDAGGNAERYAKLVQERRCTPEEQAGKDSGTCYVCGRRTMHPHAHVCMNPSCVSNAKAQRPEGYADAPCSVFDKYRNPDPRCGYPFTPDPCGYCWSFAHHVDGTGCKDMDKICPRCELWTPNAEHEPRALASRAPCSCSMGGDA